MRHRGRRVGILPRILAATPGHTRHPTHVLHRRIYGPLRRARSHPTSRRLVLVLLVLLVLDHALEKGTLGIKISAQSEEWRRRTNMRR